MCACFEFNKLISPFLWMGWYFYEKLVPFNFRHCVRSISYLYTLIIGPSDRDTLTRGKSCTGIFCPHSMLAVVSINLTQLLYLDRFYPIRHTIGNVPKLISWLPIVYESSSGQFSPSRGITRVVCVPKLSTSRIITHVVFERMLWCAQGIMSMYDYLYHPRSYVLRHSEKIPKHSLHHSVTRSIPHIPPPCFYGLSYRTFITVSTVVPSTPHTVSLGREELIFEHIWDQDDGKTSR